MKRFVIKSWSENSFKYPSVKETNDLQELKHDLSNLVFDGSKFKIFDTHERWLVNPITDETANRLGLESTKEIMK